MKEYITIYMQKPYWDTTKSKWVTWCSDNRPTTGQYYEVKIEIPPDLLKDKLGELKGEVSPNINK